MKKLFLGVMFIFVANILTAESYPIKRGTPAVSLSSGAVSILGTVPTNVQNFPTDYPNANLFTLLGSTPAVKIMDGNFALNLTTEGVPSVSTKSGIPVFFKGSTGASAMPIVVASASDGISNALVGVISTSENWGFNGVTWDRLRTCSESAKGTLCVSVSSSSHISDYTRATSTLTAVVKTNTDNISTYTNNTSTIIADMNGRIFNVMNYTQNTSTVIAEMNGRINSILNYTSWLSSNTPSNETGTLITGSGVFHGIVVNTAGVGSSVVVYDNTSVAGKKLGTIYTATDGLNVFPDAEFSTGLTYITSGATPADITILWK